MKQFLVPFNINIFDAKRAYEELEEVDWTIRTKMPIGSEVYFYCSTPVKKIIMKGVVTIDNVSFEEMIDDSEFYIDKSKVKVNNGATYRRIKFIKSYSQEVQEKITFEKLRENGLRGNIQCTQMLDNNKELYDYINEVDKISE